MAEQRKREELLDYYKKLVAGNEQEELPNKHSRFTETSGSVSSSNNEGICKFL